MKKLLLKIKSIQPKNKQLFMYLEKQLGEKLSWEQKKQAMHDFKLVQKDYREFNKVSVSVTKFNFFNNFIVRHVVTVVITAALCVSIILPVTLPLEGSHGTPGIETPMLYTASYDVPISESLLRDIKGLLLFSKDQIPLIMGVVPSWGKGFIEFVHDEPIVLSYRIDNSKIHIGNGDVFDVDYRIRTYKNYIFSFHFADFYSALEIAYVEYANEVIEKEIIYNFNVEERDGEDVRDTTVHAFLANDIKIFCHIKKRIDNTGSLAWIHFTFGGYDYFIQVTENGCKLNLEYIKETFVPALFSNIKNDEK